MAEASDLPLRLESNIGTSRTTSCSVRPDDGGMAVELRDGLVVFAAPQPTCADALAKFDLREDDLAFEWQS